MRSIGLRHPSSTFDGLIPITRLSGHVSPRLGIRFELVPDEVRLFTPAGRSRTGPIVSGWVHDHTGSYAMALYGYAALMIFGAALIASLGRPRAVADARPMPA